MKAALLGATRGMGRALARLMAERGDTLFVLGFDPEDNDRSARDLEVRAGKGRVGTASCDLEHPETFAPALEAAEKGMDGLDAVVVTAGVFGTQEALEADTERARRLMVIDFAHTATFCEHARKRLLARGGGTLCVFSSVAGDRGRKPVVIYGAAKAGLSRYLEGLDHRYRAQGLKVVCVKPGFAKTDMTEGLKPPPFASEPEAVARLALRAIDRGKPVVYAPPIWWLVMFVIRHLPRLVMRRVGF